MLVIWKERANPRRARAGTDSAVMSSPAKRTRPRSGKRLPASWLIRVVLPAPFGPMIAWVSPSRTSRSTLSLASSAPKLFVRPRTSSRVLFILAEEQSREAPPQEEHRQHQERPEDELPVLRPTRERVLDREQRKGAEHRPGDARHAAQDHHEHELARARPVHELGREVRGVVDEQRPASPHTAPAITNAASRYGYGEKPIERVRASFDLAARITMPKRESTSRCARKRNRTRNASTR